MICGKCNNEHAIALYKFKVWRPLFLMPTWQDQIAARHSGGGLGVLLELEALARGFRRWPKQVASWSHTLGRVVWWLRLQLQVSSALVKFGSLPVTRPGCRNGSDCDTTPSPVLLHCKLIWFDYRLDLLRYISSLESQCPENYKYPRIPNTLLLEQKFLTEGNGKDGLYLWFR